MDSLVLVVEGKGEIEAAPALLRRILWELFERFDFSTIRPISSRGRFRLLKQGGLENFLASAAAVEGCKGILVLLDAENEIGTARHHLRLNYRNARKMSGFKSRW